jgi:hypothetical protein
MVGPRAARRVLDGVEVAPQRGHAVATQMPQPGWGAWQRRRCCEVPVGCRRIAQRRVRACARLERHQLQAVRTPTARSRSAAGARRGGLLGEGERFVEPGQRATLVAPVVTDTRCEAQRITRAIGLRCDGPAPAGSRPPRCCLLRSPSARSRSRHGLTSTRACLNAIGDSLRCNLASDHSKLNIKLADASIRSEGSVQKMSLKELVSLRCLWPSQSSSQHEQPQHLGLSGSIACIVLALLHRAPLLNRLWRPSEDSWPDVVVREV